MPQAEVMMLKNAADRPMRRAGVLLTFACALLIPLGAVALNQATDFGKPEIDGLRATAGDVSWRGETISIAYTLQWTDRNNAWRLDDEAPVNISFWVSDIEPTRRVSRAIAFVSLPKSFLARITDTMTATVITGVPHGAAAVSLALGTSGLETGRVALPKP
jgi:hypothetical protein